MTSDRSPATPSRPPLRLWPGITLAVVLVLLRYGTLLVAPSGVFVAVIGGFAGALLIVLWWLFLSRAPWAERLAAVGLAVVAMVVNQRFLDPSVARGNMGFQYLLVGVPPMAVALVAWAVATRRWEATPRRAALVATVVLVSTAWTLVRSKGVGSDAMPELVWRWSETAEERLLATADDEPPPIPPTARPEPTASREPTAAPEPPASSAEPATVGEAATEPEPRPVAAEAPAAERSEPEAVAAVTETAVAPEPASPWPGLRGPRRDGVVPGLRIATDWSATPPAELWRRPVGPAVSSFAVRGELVFTQEQRGDDEVVSAYRLATGEPVWRHHDPARFWDAHVGAGPRATPAVAGNRVYTLGATGILNALDADTGAVVWTRQVATDEEAKVPGWGFTGSPLVVGDLLVVEVRRLVAYDLASGEPRWRGPEKHPSYSSPHLVTLAGVPQILMIGVDRTISVSPADGALLWEHPWAGIGTAQPVQIGDGELLLSLIDAGAVPLGVRRITVANGPDGWSAVERWTSDHPMTSFSDLVVHGGFVYGVDGRMLACVDLETGERRWKGGRYGEAQVLLLPDQGLLLVVTEQGELALVEAAADAFHELARLPAITGRTWSRPALAGDVLLVRNGEEMAAFRLPGEPAAGR